MKFFSTAPQVTPNVSFLVNVWSYFLTFGHIFVGPSDVISVAVSDVRPPRKLIYLFFLSLRVLLIELVASHLPEMHDEAHKQITICNDTYKYAAYPHSILQEFVVKNV